MKIIKLDPARWQEYKQLRLKGLKNDPQAFGSKYEDQVKNPDEYWIGRLNDGNAGEKSVLLFAEEAGELVGITGAIINSEESEAEVISVYVADEARGKGVASMLLAEILEKLKVKGIKQVKLAVRPSQAAAIRVYEKTGFQRSGETGGEIQMYKRYT